MSNDPKDRTDALSVLSEALRESHERKEAERLEWEREMGPPDVFVPCDDIQSGHGLGYWGVSRLTENGEVKEVWEIRRYSNGYQPNTLVRYPEEHILLLYSLLHKR